MADFDTYLRDIDALCRLRQEEYPARGPAWRSLTGRLVELSQWLQACRSPHPSAELTERLCAAATSEPLFVAGYYKSGTQCLGVRVPENARLSAYGNSWVCNDGYQKSGNACIKR